LVARFVFRGTPLLSHRCRNGTLIEIRPASTRITLPSGETALGEAQHTESQRRTARQLGYGDDVLAMVRQHDPLHALLADWLGIEASYGIMAGADEARGSRYRGIRVSSRDRGAEVHAGCR
jgi:hypothetical protein